MSINVPHDDGISGHMAMSVPQPPGVDTAMFGPCSLGYLCSAPEEELNDEYKCRLCGKQLHGFISGCSKPRNEGDFRDGVICKDQPCVASLLPSLSTAATLTSDTNRVSQKSRTDGVVRLCVATMAITTSHLQCRALLFFSRLHICPTHLGVCTFFLYPVIFRQDPPQQAILNFCGRPNSLNANVTLMLPS
jgi:hypothetical protein